MSVCPLATVCSLAPATTVIGAIFGALSGFYAGRWADEVILWLMGVLDAIPFYLFVAAVAFAMQGHPYGMHVALVATLWTTTGRVVRGEVIKIRNLEFVGMLGFVGNLRLVLGLLDCLNCWDLLGFSKFQNCHIPKHPTLPNPKPK